MLRRPALAALALVLLLPGCATDRSLVPPASSDWRSSATEADRERLRGWRDALEEAVSKARASGFGARVDAEGALFKPDAALGGDLPFGTYRCRIFKLGGKTDRNLDFVAYPQGTCLVAAGGKVRWFARLGGAQRPTGFIYPADRLRSVFLGAVSLGDETASMRYGVDPDRDLAGWVERIGEQRWRILLPSPRLESETDVIELVPAA